MHGAEEDGEDTEGNGRFKWRSPMLKNHITKQLEKIAIFNSLKKTLSQVTRQLSITSWMHGPPKQSYLLSVALTTSNININVPLKFPVC